MKADHLYTTPALPSDTWRQSSYVSSLLMQKAAAIILLNLMGYEEYMIKHTELLNKSVTALYNKSIISVT